MNVGRVLGLTVWAAIAAAWAMPAPPPPPVPLTVPAAQVPAPKPSATPKAPPGITAGYHADGLWVTLDPADLWALVTVKEKF